LPQIAGVTLPRVAASRRSHRREAKEPDMTETADAGCQCGCNLVSDITNANEACGCGCNCCSGPPKNVDDEIAELHTLRQQIDHRLSELERS
jgi:hypothetical protein